MCASLPSSTPSRLPLTLSCLNDHSLRSLPTPPPPLPARSLPQAYFAYIPTTIALAIIAVIAGLWWLKEQKKGADAVRIVAESKKLEAAMSKKAAKRASAGSDAAAASASADAQKAADKKKAKELLSSTSLDAVRASNKVAEELLKAEELEEKAKAEKARAKAEKEKKKIENLRKEAQKGSAQKKEKKVKDDEDSDEDLSLLAKRTK